MVSSSSSSSSIRAGVSSLTRCTLLAAGFFGSEGKVGQTLLRCPDFLQRKQSPFSWHCLCSSGVSLEILMASTSIALGSWDFEEDGENI